MGDKSKTRVPVCDDCARYIYDDESGEWYCSANMDEDEYQRMAYMGIYGGHKGGCPYYSPDDEYAIVRKQI